MSQEADQLRAEIATAEARLAQIESRPVPKAQLSAVEHQIQLAKKGLRNMRIKLASLEDRTNCCPVCAGTTPPGWMVCEACSRETPATLHNTWQCANHRAHAARANKKAPSLIAQAEETERQAKEQIIAYLKQHGSAI